jgi:hypothetical protein
MYRQSEVISTLIMNATFQAIQVTTVSTLSRFPFIGVAEAAVAGPIVIDRAIYKAGDVFE